MNLLFMILKYADKLSPFLNPTPVYVQVPLPGNLDRSMQRRKFCRRLSMVVQFCFIEFGLFAEEQAPSRLGRRHGLNGACDVRPGIWPNDYEHYPNCQ